MFLSQRPLEVTDPTFKEAAASSLRPCSEGQAMLPLKFVAPTHEGVGVALPKSHEPLSEQCYLSAVLLSTAHSGGVARPPHSHSPLYIHSADRETEASKVKCVQGPSEHCRKGETQESHLDCGQSQERCIWGQVFYQILLILFFFNLTVFRKSLLLCFNWL